MAKGIELTLKEGDKAPPFKASTNGGEIVQLKDFKGQYVVLYFYPKDNTPGCNKEACAFRDQYEPLTTANAVVLGVSADSVKSHEKFVDKFNLPFQLLSDENKEIINLYGVWGPKQFMGRKFDGIG